MYIFDPVDRTPTTLAQPALNEMSENLLNLIKRIYQLVVKLFKARGSLPSTVKNQVVQGVVQNIAKNNRTQFQAATDNVKKETPALTRNVTGAAAVGAAFGAFLGGVGGGLVAGYNTLPSGNLTDSQKSMLSNINQGLQVYPEFQRLVEAVKSSAKTVASGAGAAILSSVAVSMLTDNVAYIAAVGIATVVATCSDSAKSLANRAMSYFM